MKDIQHLIRGGFLAIFIIVGFTIVRFIVVPESFGKYGHYRADAVAEEMARTPVYQGADTCKICHNQKGKRAIYLGYENWSSGKHGVVNCENCHGPADKHVDKSATKTTTITINRSKELCLRCHLQLPARPGTTSIFPQPQIELAKHMEDKGNLSCLKCHNPHHPDLKPKEEEVVVTEPAEKEATKVGEEKSSAISVISKIGQKVYEDKCLVCHGKTGNGKTEAAEFLDPKPPDFSSSSYKSTFNQIVDFIHKGKGEQMPAYKDELNDIETKEVARYIQGFRK